MSRRDHISSTEKLLDVIRGDEPAVSEPAEDLSKPDTPKKRRPTVKKARSSGKGITVGVDLAYTNLKLVMIKQVSENRWRFLGCTNVPFDPEIPRESPEFSSFLKKTLRDFVGFSRKYDMWALMSSARIEIRHIRIPKVPKKQIANAVYWTFKKEVDFVEDKNILDFEVIGDISEEGVEKIALTAYTAPRQEIEQLKNLFSGAGFPLTGISIGPFAVQNMLRTGWAEAGDKATASLYVGRNWSRIDVFSSGNLILARGIKAGMSSAMECIVDGVNEERNKISLEYSDDDTLTPTAAENEAPIDMEQAKGILYCLSPDFRPVTGGGPDSPLNNEEIFEMILPALQRLVRQVERSFEYCSLNLGLERVEKLFLAGQINIFTRHVLDYVSDQTGVPCEVFDPLSPEIPFIDKVSTIPDSVSERASFASAVGMALSSSSRTPNLIFTYKEKDKLESISRINRTIFMIFLFVIAVCTGVFLWQGQESDKRRTKVTGLEQKLAKYNPPLNKDLILQWSVKTTKQFELLKTCSEKYLSMAAIGELSKITPSDIRLVDLTAELGPCLEDKEKTASISLIIEGIIFGEPEQLDDSLSAYLMKLEDSPIFSEITVHNTKIEDFENKEVLHFWTRLNLG